MSHTIHAKLQFPLNFSTELYSNSGNNHQPAFAVVTSNSRRQLYTQPVPNLSQHTVKSQYNYALYQQSAQDDGDNVHSQYTAAIASVACCSSRWSQMLEQQQARAAGTGVAARVCANQ